MAAKPVFNYQMPKKELESYNDKQINFIKDALYKALDGQYLILLTAIEEPFIAQIIQ